MDAEELQKCLTQSGISGTYSREIFFFPSVEIALGNSLSNFFVSILEMFFKTFLSHTFTHIMQSRIMLQILLSKYCSVCIPPPRR